MIVKIIQALNQPEKLRQIRVSTKPVRKGVISDLIVTMPIPPVVLREMQGSPKAYFNATAKNGKWTFYSRVEPIEEW